ADQPGAEAGDPPPQRPDEAPAPVPPQDMAAGDAAPDTSILSRLPVPLLIHSGDELHYCNDEFLALTGYDSLDDLAASGGLEALFIDHPQDEARAQDQTGDQTRDSGEDEERHALFLRRKD